METNRIFANMWRIIEKAKKNKILLDSIELDYEGSDENFQESFLNNFQMKFKEESEGKVDLKNCQYIVLFSNDLGIDREYEVNSFDSLISTVNELSEMILGDTSAYIISCGDKNNVFSFSFAGVRE